MPLLLRYGQVMHRAWTDPLLPCNARFTDPAAGIRDICGPVSPSASQPVSAIAFQPLSAAFGEQSDRYTATVIFADQTIDNLVHVIGENSR